MQRINSLTKIFILFAVILLSCNANKKYSVIIMSDLHYDSTEVRRVVMDSVIKDYNISGIFHGHDHAIQKYKWKGIDVWSAGSPQSGNKTGNFLLLTLNHDTLLVRKARVNKIKSLN